MKKIYTSESTGASVYRNSEWDEYVVKWPSLGKDCNYYTDDKQDAIDTANMTNAR